MTSAGAHATMRGVYLPGGRRVQTRRVPVPEPGEGQVLVRMRSSTICGSDLRAIYREHVGSGPEAYADVIAGHEPCGDIVETGHGCRRFRSGDRVVVYHIAGCGVCRECRSGYMIGCTSPKRAAYGWQRDGGHADYLLADESTCILLPDALSHLDGACIACGFGTAYEALRRTTVSGSDAVLVTGMGPVGMAVGLLARALGSPLVIGVDTVASRLELARCIGAADACLEAGSDTVGAVTELTGGEGCEVSVDCSGSERGRETALAGTRRWGRCALVGEGGRFSAMASPQIIHRQISVHGSWVTSIGRMEELTGLLVRWSLHPECVVTERFGLDEAAKAYEVADEGRSGKVAIVMD
jgi:threonine dehydrogenase-like Zn-dependent dehydrogenase